MKSFKLFGLVLVFYAVAFGEMSINEMLDTPVNLQYGNAMQQRVATNIIGLMTQYHYARQPMTPNLCSQWYKNYFEMLDPQKVLFTKDDIDMFSGRETNLYSPWSKRVDLEFPFQVYRLLLLRTWERARFIKQLAETSVSLHQPGTILIDRKKMEFPANAIERQKLWEQQFVNELILLKLDEERKANKSKDDEDDDDEDDPLKDKENKSMKEKIDDLVKSYARVYRRRTELESNDIFELYMNAFTELFDPHSTYMAPESKQDFDINMSLSLQGIGATLSSKNGYTTVVDVVAGGPADRDGRLKAGDKIIEVAQDGKEAENVIEMPLKKVVKKIRGPKDTKVHLTIQPRGSRDTKVITLTRDLVKVNDMEAKSSMETVTRKNGVKLNILVMHLPSFYCDFEAMEKRDDNYKSTTRDMTALLQEYTRKGKKPDGVVLDLRANGGGSLEEAISLAGLFNPGTTPVVQVRDSEGSVNTRTDFTDGCQFDGPVVILVDHYSASASEIVAAALQDLGSAIVVGDSQTHGKGTVQSMIDLKPRNTFFAKFRKTKEPSGALKLTIAKFYRITGGSTQEKGVVPDIILPSINDVIEDLGEKNLPHCLPWDTIDPIRFSQSPVLKAILPTLKERSLQRMKASDEWKQLQKDIQFYADAQKVKEMHLDIDKRRDLYQQQEQAVKILTKRIRENSNLTFRKSKKKKQYKDITLQEALYIVADMHELMGKNK